LQKIERGHWQAINNAERPRGVDGWSSLALPATADRLLRVERRMDDTIPEPSADDSGGFPEPRGDFDELRAAGSAVRKATFGVCVGAASDSALVRVRAVCGCLFENLAEVRFAHSSLISLSRGSPVICSGMMASGGASLAASLHISSTTLSWSFKGRAAQ
jgi:hypothetical protein